MAYLILESPNGSQYATDKCPDSEEAKHHQNHIVHAVLYDTSLGWWIYTIHHDLTLVASVEHSTTTPLPSVS